jgi:Ca2+-binding RTX toxin-like protein
LVFGTGLNPEDVEITRNGYNLIFKITSTGEHITVKDWYADTRNQIARIKFTDGTIWTHTQVNAMIPIFRGTDGDDEVTGSAWDDALIGGVGDDILTGGNGNDTFIWNIGDGNDIVNNNSSNYNPNGILKLGEGVDPSEVELTRSGNDAVLIVTASGERITVLNWYSDSRNQLGYVEFADGTIWTRAQINAMSPVLRGTDADDTITGTASGDTLIGRAGADTLSGGAGDDTLIGGTGIDTLTGGEGNDTFIWNIGDGDDIVNNNSGNYNPNGTLKFGEGVDPDEVELTRSGNDAVFIVTASGERITVLNWYADSRNQLGYVEFSDGTVWTRAQINAISPILRGTDADDTITGYGTNDTLIGHAGDDTLSGGDGDDTLIGGTGDDTLTGGGGDDTYKWDIGDGDDIVNNYSGNYNPNGTLKFGEGVDPAEVELNRYGNDAVFIVTASGERITVLNWYDGSRNQLGYVEFADVTVWTRAQINTMNTVFHGTNSDDTLNGGAGNDTLIGGVGNDTLKGEAGNDILIGGTGSDYLEGGAGNDIYVWNLGDGDDMIYDYTSTKSNSQQTGILKFGEGIDPANVELTREGEHAVFIIGETGERVTVQYWWYSYNTYGQLSSVEFADGTVWTREDINAMNPILRGTSGNDTITGFNTDEILLGGVGNDTLKGEAGNDTLIGGAGSDRLEGGAGNDIYKWNIGDGNDLIVDNSGQNVLELGEGINPLDIALARLGNDAVFTFDGTGEQISVYNWYSNTNNQLNSVQFSNGTVWSREDINNSVA